MNQQSTFNPLYLFPLMAGLALLLSSCDNEKPIIEPGPDPMTAESVEDYLQSLPSWSSFSPPGADLPPAPTGEAGQSQTDTLDVQMIQEDGSIDTLYNVVYDCQQIPYSIQQNPEDIVMYSPDREILFPGALIQGKSHKEFLGSLLGLPIAERSPIRVSIPSLPSGGNFRAIARPNQANVSAAVGEMIGNATREGLSAPSTISFKMESYHSERQMALAMGLSGKYLGFSGSASGAFSRNQSETTITVQFFQKMFEVVVEPPQTPGAFFDADFTQAKLQEQVDLGRMGPTNLPVYVSNVVYGRMMMFSLTSTASEEDIRATLQLAYSNLAGNVTANMSAKQKKIIQTAKIAITSLGGDAQATIDMIRSGNWRDYFTSSAPLSSAAPLSYTFRNLGDGSIASVTETDEYSISSCTERIAVPGPFDFLNPQTYNLGDIGVPMETHQGDFNGDGMADIAFNHKAQGVNTIKLAYGNAQGGFDLQPSQNHSVSNESWGSFETLIGDFNGDGQDDLAWNRLTSDNNQSYFALSQGGGSYRYPTRRDYPATGWIDYQAFVGDLDGNGKQELIWNILRINTTNRTYRGEWIENDSVSIVRVQDFGGSRWDLWEAYVGNVDGGGDDMIWNRKFGGNFTVFGLSDPNGGLQHSGSIQHSGNSFSTWKTSLVLGNNDTHTDLVFSQAAYNRNSNDYSNTIRTLLSDGNGGMDWAAYFQVHPRRDINWGEFKLCTGDISGDGIDDLVWVTDATNQPSNQIHVGLGTSTGEFDFGVLDQTHPVTDTWSQYQTLLIDVNGDRKKDLVWISTGGNAKVYVALSRE